MIFISLFVGLMLAAVGILCYKFPNMISPYGGMSPERQAKVDIEGMRYGLLWVSVIAGAASVLLAVTSKLVTIHPKSYSRMAMAVVILYAIAVIVVMFRHNGLGRGKEGVACLRGRYRAAEPIPALCSVAFVVVLLAIVLAVANRPVEIGMDDGVLHISGVYGRKIPVEAIVSIEVIDEMPDMAMRISGSKFNKKIKGYYLTSDDEECLLFVNHNSGPFLKLRMADQLIYLNRATPSATLELIQELNDLNQKKSHGEGE